MSDSDSDVEANEENAEAEEATDEATRMKLFIQEAVNATIGSAGKTFREDMCAKMISATTQAVHEVGVYVDAFEKFGEDD